MKSDVCMSREISIYFAFPTSSGGWSVWYDTADPDPLAVLL